MLNGKVSQQNIMNIVSSIISPPRLNPESLMKQGVYHAGCKTMKDEDLMSAAVNFPSEYISYSVAAAVSCGDKLHLVLKVRN